MSCRWEQREAPPGTGDQPKGAASTRRWGPPCSQASEAPGRLCVSPAWAGRVRAGFRVASAAFARTP